MPRQTFLGFLRDSWPVFLAALWITVFVGLMGISFGLVHHSPMLGFGLFGIAVLWMLYGIYRMKQATAAEAVALPEDATEALLERIRDLAPEERARLMDALDHDRQSERPG